MLYSKIFFSFFSIFIGVIFGSFINVVIYRLPNNQSILRPRSFCPNCKNNIPWYENVPIYSWIKLKGRCSKCRKAISIKYPLTELFTGLLFLVSFYAIPSNINFENFIITLLSNWSLTLILLPISIIDCNFLWIPNSIIKIGIIFGFIISIISGFLKNQEILINVFENLISGILGFLIIVLIMKFGEVIFKKPAMGLGDAKLAGMLGLWLGFPGVIVSIWSSFIIAGLFIFFGLASKKIIRQQLIPFGPFLSITGFLVWIYGEATFLRLLF